MKEAFSVAPEVETEYSRLKSECILNTSNLTTVFSVALLNIRSLSKHLIDMAADPSIKNSNLILLTETQVSHTNESNIIQDQFSSHQLVMHNDPVDPFKSLAFFKRININHSATQYSGILFAEFHDPFNRNFEKISVLLLYRSNNSSNNVAVLHFITEINFLITLHKPDLVLGDFNINALANPSLLDTIKHQGYTLLGNEPTHIMGGLLDQVYVKNHVSYFDKINLVTKPVYYSDHDAIFLNWSI